MDFTGLFVKVDSVEINRQPSNQFSTSSSVQMWPLAFTANRGYIEGPVDMKTFNIKDEISFIYLFFKEFSVLNNFGSLHSALPAPNLFS